MIKIFARGVYLVLTVLMVSSHLAAQHLKLDPGLPAYFLKKNGKFIHVLVREANFQTRDIIADVGAGDGLFDAGISIFTDSLIFYMEDIDSNAFNQNKFDRAIQFYSSVKKRRITNSFIPSLGKEKSTELQPGIFDKVLIIDTYHHFSYRDEMIHDINRIIKPGGELFIYDVLARKEGDMHPVCQTTIYLKEDILAQIQAHGFIIKDLIKLKKASSRKARLFIFRKS